jgi:aminoglycoside phosphotransferase family enzyme
VPRPRGAGFRSKWLVRWLDGLDDAAFLAMDLERLTPTQKIRRPYVLATYAAEIDALYA